MLLNTYDHLFQDISQKYEQGLVSAEAYEAYTKLLILIGAAWERLGCRNSSGAPFGLNVQAQQFRKLKGLYGGFEAFLESMPCLSDSRPMSELSVPIQHYFRLVEWAGDVDPTYPGAGEHNQIVNMFHEQ